MLLLAALVYTRLGEIAPLPAPLPTDLLDTLTAYLTPAERETHQREGL